MNNTYFIHIKKEDMLRDDIIEIVKNNILNISQNEIILEKNIKKIELNMIKKIDKNNIGKIEVNINNNIKCDLCDKNIKKNSKIKKLNCGDKFHIKCINYYFNSSCYLDCPICGIENLSNNIDKLDNIENENENENEKNDKIFNNYE